MKFRLTFLPGFFIIAPSLTVSNSFPSQKLAELKSSYGKLLRQVGAVTTIPMILAAGPLVGYWMGGWADQHFGTDPWGKVIVLLLGFGASLKQVVTIIQRLIKEEE